jgi:hypothetical protein
MSTSAVKRILRLALLTGSVPGVALAASDIKAGKWQFTTEMQLPAMSQSTGVQAPPGNNQPMTRTACVDPAHPIPAEQQCTLDNVKRIGPNVTWAMTCNSPQGAIQSSGSGRYAGDNMEARVIARIPGANGKPVDAPGRITGHYIGPCE